MLTRRLPQTAAAALVVTFATLPCAVALAGGYDDALRLEREYHTPGHQDNAPARSADGAVIISTPGARNNRPYYRDYRNRGFRDPRYGKRVPRHRAPYRRAPGSGGSQSGGTPYWGNLLGP